MKRPFIKLVTQDRKDNIKLKKFRKSSALRYG